MKIVLYGDERGLPVLLQKITFENVAGIVCASIRLQQIDLLEAHEENTIFRFLFNLNLMKLDILILLRQY